MATSYEGYEIGCATNSEGQPLAWPLIKSRVDGKIKSIMHGSGADTYCVYMSGHENFREDVATIRPYKGNRSNKPKPFWHDRIEEYLKSGLNHPVVVCDGYEADDGMSMAQCAGFPDMKSLAHTIICSRDKDLWMVPGWHYSWGTSNCKEKEPWFTTEAEGYHHFFSQLITGDSTDNIPGLYGMGQTNVKYYLKGVTEPLEMYRIVKKLYDQRFGSYSTQFIEENGTLLWMLREDSVKEYIRITTSYEAANLLEDFQCMLEDKEEMLNV